MKETDLFHRNIPNHELIERVFDTGQGHIFNWWNEISAEERKMLLNQIDHIEFDFIDKAFQIYQQGCIKEINTNLKPVEGVRLDGDILLKSKKLGVEALRDGRVCSLVLGGGLGTRLAFGSPKGMFPIGSISGESLFEMFAEKIKKLSDQNGTIKSIPWYIMTSDATDSETKSFFKKGNYFNLQKEDITFFKQGMLPAVDFRGKLIMNSRSHIFENPDGHGGLIKALGKSGILEDMSQKGIGYIFIHNIDNPLVKVCDPSFIGYHIDRNSDFSCRYVTKLSEDEPVGSIVEENGRIKILEYTDIPKYFANGSDQKKALILSKANMNVFVINVDFLRQLYVERILLPIRFTKKKIPMIDSSGIIQIPKETNGIVLESKIFDVLEYTKSSTVIEGNRIDEFSPLKNREGLDSSVSVLSDMNRLFASWIAEAGIYFPEEKVKKIEIRPTFAIDHDTFKEKVSSIGLIEINRIVKEQINNYGYIYLR